MNRKNMILGLVFLSSNAVMIMHANMEQCNIQGCSAKMAQGFKKRQIQTHDLQEGYTATMHDYEPAHIDD